MQVCAPTFQSVLAVKRKRIINIAKYVWEHNNSRPERRGGKRERQGYSELREQIRDHIRSFRCVSSHYGRNKTPHRRYLPSTLNIRRMWKMFLDQYTGTLLVQYDFYHAIFVKEFNLGFGSPKTDVCSYCKGHHHILPVKDQKPAIKATLFCFHLSYPHSNDTCTCKFFVENFHFMYSVLCK